MFERALWGKRCAMGHSKTYCGVQGPVPQYPQLAARREGSIGLRK